MAQPFPLPPETRETPTLFGDGVSATYGPFSFKAFETGDIKVYRKLAADVRFTEAAVTVTKTAGLQQDTFTVTFPAIQLATTRFVVVAKRLHTRTAGLDKGVGLSVNALEKEFSKQGTILQELRRDIEDRAIKADYDIDVPTLIEQGIVDHLLIFGPNNTIINTTKSIYEILDAQTVAEAAAAAAAASAIEAANSANDAAGYVNDAAGYATDAANSANDAADAAALAQATVGTLSGAPVETIYDYTGLQVTHTLAANVKYFEVLGVGGGASGQSVFPPQSGSGNAYDASGGGGASGHYGETGIFANNVGPNVLTIYVGKRGSVDGVNGLPPTYIYHPAEASWVICAALGFGKYTFHPGISSTVTPVNSNTPIIYSDGVDQIPLQLTDNLAGKKLKITCQNFGEPGVAGLKRHGGTGGSSPWGRGGMMFEEVSIMVERIDGIPGQGYGSGGSGAAVGEIPSINDAIEGGRGSHGRIIVREWHV